ncbi:hypothetical protein OG966_39865 [Streptomyces sp. NBC_01750]|nr:hypothetical protein [Streptomyces sp. NBC_01750]WSD37509.1 hypothetical protein OG966_39865 [Streptomyces sp. NBC_01750]
MATDWLLTQNDRMKKQGIFNWTLPAWAVRLEDQNPDGTTTVRNINVCPQASICASGIAALIVSHGAVSLCRRVVARLSSVPMSFIVSLSVPLVWPRSRSLAGLLVVCPLEDPRRELPCLGMVISGGWPASAARTSRLLRTLRTSGRGRGRHRLRRRRRRPACRLGPSPHIPLPPA